MNDVKANDDGRTGGAHGAEDEFFQVLEREPEERDGVQDLLFGRVSLTRNLKKHVYRM